MRFLISVAPAAAHHLMPPSSRSPGQSSRHPRHDTPGCRLVDGLHNNRRWKFPFPHPGLPIPSTAQTAGSGIGREQARTSARPPAGELQGAFPAAPPADAHEPSLPSAASRSTACPEPFGDPPGLVHGATCAMPHRAFLSAPTREPASPLPASARRTRKTESPILPTIHGGHAAFPEPGSVPGMHCSILYLGLCFTSMKTFAMYSPRTARQNNCMAPRYRMTSESDVHPGMTFPEK